MLILFLHVQGHWRCFLKSLITLISMFKVHEHSCCRTKNGEAVNVVQLVGSYNILTEISVLTKLPWALVTTIIMMSEPIFFLILVIFLRICLRNWWTECWRIFQHSIRDKSNRMVSLSTWHATNAINHSSSQFL